MNKILEIGENIKNSPDFEGIIKTDVPLSKHTTMKVGGNAILFIEPASCSSLKKAVSVLAKNDVPHFILGGGSNVIFADEGYSGAVINTLALCNIFYDDENQELECECGVTIESITKFCEENSLSGFETFSGLPGTIGGAAFMNARCYEKEMSDIISSVEFAEFTKEGGLQEQIYKSCKNDWEYKKSPFSGTNKIILKTKIKVKKQENNIQIKENDLKYINDRIQKGHFKFPSSGSVFKNNRNFGKPSGKLIDEAGLKGTFCGGAQIAPYHANIIINTGNATCSDIKNLVSIAKDEVLKREGFLLETEIIFVQNNE